MLSALSAVAAKARPAPREPRGNGQREHEKHGRRIYAHNRIERKAHARGGEDGDNGKAISPDATGICNCLSHPSEEFAELEGHIHLLISRIQASLYETGTSTAKLVGYLRNCINCA